MNTANNTKTKKTQQISLCKVVVGKKGLPSALHSKKGVVKAVRTLQKCGEKVPKNLPAYVPISILKNILEISYSRCNFQ